MLAEIFEVARNLFAILGLLSFSLVLLLLALFWVEEHWQRQLAAVRCLKCEAKPIRAYHGDGLYGWWDGGRRYLCLDCRPTDWDAFYSPDEPIEPAIGDLHRDHRCTPQGEEK